VYNCICVIFPKLYLVKKKNFSRLTKLDLAKFLRNWLELSAKKTCQGTHRSVGHAAPHGVSRGAISGRIAAPREARRGAREARGVQARRLRVDHLLGRVHVLFTSSSSLTNTKSRGKRAALEKKSRSSTLSMRRPFDFQVEL
jgi:hypothetical protein